MIDVRDLRVDYDQVCAVRDLTLHVGPGEIFGLIGPNGAGKTTTLRAMAGLIEPTYGDVVLNGFDIREQREEAEQFLGFMPDSAPMYDDLMVWEYLDLFAASYKIPRERRKDVVEKYLEMVDLTQKTRSGTTDLSKGMKQRLMLARTLISDPKVLLLDEPASGLDPHGRLLLKDILRSLSAQGKTVIISSHILSELSDFCTSVGIMEQGQLVLSGPVDQVAERVLGRGRIRIEILSGTEALESLVASHGKAGSLVHQANAFEFEFDGSQDEVSTLLSELVAAGVQIISFGRIKSDLEEVFLKVGAKEVS